MPEPAPALTGFTVESTALDSGAITSPWPYPKTVNTSASHVADGAAVDSTNAANAKLVKGNGQMRQIQ